jgi:hypothetical protein
MLGPAGSFTYSPTLDFNGTDSFTFVASDGLLDSNEATVALTVTAVNATRRSRATTPSAPDEDTPLTP